MNVKKQLQRACTELGQRLTSRRFLSQSGLERETVSELWNHFPWQERLSAVLPIRERILCADVLEVCRPAMERLAGPEEPEGGWLKYAYGTASRLLYPDLGQRADDERCWGACILFIETLHLVLDFEREVMPFDKELDFAFLTAEEAAGCLRGGEYMSMMQAWKEQHIDVLLRLGNEATPFSTLSHIAGVHYVAMIAARGLAAAGVPVDLALVSGAAAGHDLGKYGCKPGERVPYLHYFYTDQWFTRMGLPSIGHIAANHSTWDLEP